MYRVVYQDRCGVRQTAGRKTISGAFEAGAGTALDGGQRLSIQPGIGLIVAVLAGNYSDLDNWVMPVRIIEEHIAPKLHRRLGK